MLSNIIDVQSYRMLAEKLLPLAVQYEKSGVAMLSVSLQLTCARIFDFIGLKQQFSFTLADAWKSCQLLGFEDKTIAFDMVLQSINQGKLLRKWVLYRSLMAATLKHANRTEPAMEAFSDLLNHLIDSNDGWSSIRQTIMRELLRLAENSPDPSLYYVYSWQYLASETSSIDSDDQIKLIDSMRKRASIESVTPTVQTLSPIFVGLQMLPLSSGLLISNTSNGTASEAISPFGPFIYAPNQDVTRKLSQCSNLIMNEPVQIIITLKNPFVAPLELGKISLLFDRDDACPCTANSVVIPALSKSFPVNISILPQSCGKFNITGVSAKFSNLQLELQLDKPLEYNVAPAQPLLQWSGSETDNELVLYEGEMLALNLPLKNHSDVSIKSLSISFTIKESSIPLEDRINLLLFERPLSETVVASSELESFDSDSIKIPTTVYGHPQVCGFTANVMYSGCSKYWRQLLIPYACTVLPVISVKECGFTVLEKETCKARLVLSNQTEQQAFVIINETSHNFNPNEAKEIYFTIPRLNLDDLDLNSKLPCNERQIATLRKLCKPESVGFLDGDYEESLYDATLYWIKMHLQKYIKITWKIDHKNGYFNLARLQIDPKYYSTITWTEPIVTCSIDKYSAKIGEFIEIDFVCKLEEATLDISPLVELGNGILAVNYENALLVSGPLKSILRRREPQILTFIPITQADFVIKYHVSDMKQSIDSSGEIRIKVAE